jgi:hypothetical protein
VRRVNDGGDQARHRSPVTRIVGGALARLIGDAPAWTVVDERGGDGASAMVRSV